MIRLVGLYFWSGFCTFLYASSTFPLSPPAPNVTSPNYSEALLAAEYASNLRLGSQVSSLPCFIHGVLLFVFPCWFSVRLWQT